MAIGSEFSHLSFAKIRSLRKFNEALDKFATKDVPREFVRRQIEVVIYLFKRIQQRTPRANDLGFVDEIGIIGGYAKNNWDISVNDQGKQKPRGKRGKPPEPRTEDWIRTILTDIGLDQGMKSKMGKADKISIYNNVSYVKYLETGHSKKAPHGMVAISMQETREWIKSKGWKAKV